MYVNMWWVRLFIIFITYLTGYLNISNVKIWKLTTKSKQECNGQPKHSHIVLNNKLTIVYDPVSLRHMESAVQHDYRLRTLPLNAIKTIRMLGLNVKLRSRRNHKRKGFTQTGANRANLVMVKKIPFHDPIVIIATVNVQSLKTKELQVSEVFDDHGLDILALTETWLTHKEETDKNWCEATELNKGLKSLYTHNRSKGRGSGLGLTCKSHYKVTVLRKGHKPSSEYCTWELTVKS